MTYRWRWRLSCASALARALLTVATKARVSTLRLEVAASFIEGAKDQIRVCTHIYALRVRSCPICLLPFVRLAVRKFVLNLFLLASPRALPGCPILMFSLLHHIFALAFLLLNFNILSASALPNPPLPTSIAVSLSRSTHAYTSGNGAYMHGSIVRFMYSSTNFSR